MSYDEIRELVKSYVPPLEEYQTILGHSERSAKIAREAKIDVDIRALLALRDAMRQCFLQDVDTNAIRSLVIEAGNRELYLIDKYAVAGFNKSVSENSEEAAQAEVEFEKARDVLRRIMRKKLDFFDKLYVKYYNRISF